MDYLKLLPQNVHEEILQRFPQKKRSVEILYGDYESIFGFTFHIKIVFDMPKDINNIFNRCFPSSNDNTPTVVRKYKVNQITHYKNSNIFFVSYSKEKDEGFLFDGKQKIYFRRSECLNLDDVDSKSLLTLFKQWSHCNICSENKEESIKNNENNEKINE